VPVVESVLAQATLFDETKRAIGANGALVQRIRLQPDPPVILDLERPAQQRLNRIAA
jgi:hypothetical protein